MQGIRSSSLVLPGYSPISVIEWVFKTRWWVGPVERRGLCKKCFLTERKNSHEGQTWSMLVFSGPVKLRVKRLSLVMTLGLRILLVRHQFNKLSNSPGCRSCLFPEGEELDSERSSWYGQIFFGQLCPLTYVVETQVCTWVILSPRAGCRRVDALTRRLSSREGAS